MDGASFRFQAGRCSPTSCSRTRSTARRPRPSPPCWKPCRSTRSPSGDATHKLPEPFFVLATQNPLEMEGTYPLPEAQLDRFFLKILVPFPSADTLRGIVLRTIQPPDSLPVVVDGPRLLAMRAIARSVPVASNVADYAIALVLATHPERRRSAQLDQTVRAGWRQPARPAGVDYRRAGLGPARRQIQCLYRRYPEPGPAGTAAPDPAQL